MACEWHSAPLGELISYIGKGVAPKYINDGLDATMVLGQKCVRNQSLQYEQARFHNSAEKAVNPDKEVRKGDILINATGVGSAGRVAQVMADPSRQCITDGHVITLRAKDINPFYLGYFVKSKQKTIELMAEGSTGQTEMNRQRLQSEIIVTFPESKDLQKRIAEYGLAIDKKITVNNQLNDYLANLLDAAFANSAKSGSKEFGLPEVVDILSGGTPRTKNAEYWEDGRIPFFTPGDVTNSVYTLTTEKHITDVGLDNCNSELYPVDTVFLTARGTVGKVAIAGRPMAMNQSCFAFRGKSIPQSVVFQIIKNAVKTLRAKANGATFAAINTRDLKIETVAVPCNKEIAHYDESASKWLDLIRTNEEENLQLSALRDILLPKLMSGEIDVSKVDLTQLTNNHLADC